jgi:hypothetical protein
VALVVALPVADEAEAVDADLDGVLPAPVDEVDLSGERVEAGAGGLVEEQGDVRVGGVLHAEGRRAASCLSSKMSGRGEC